MQHIRTHDGLFKFVFGEPEQMAELLRACLPAKVAAAIDWSTLARVPGSFVDKALKGRATDLLFTARMGKATVLLYVVPEHKSANDRFAAWQIACYVVRILEQWRREHPDEAELPAVLPLVVYHGDQPWDSPRSPHELVDWSRCDPDLAAFLAPRQLQLPYLLLDLSQYDEQRIEDLRLSAVSSLTLRFLQFLRSCPPEKVAGHIRSWAPLVGFLTTYPRGQEVLFALLSWYTASSKADLDTVRNVMNQIHEENPPMRTTLDLLLEDNERRGMAKGLRAMVEAQLRIRFGELPDHVRDRIAEANSEVLQKWGLRVLTATSADDVVAHG